MFFFRDRAEAGRLLARRLKRYARRSDVIVLALPRGGVPVGYEIAAALHAPLEVFIVRKLGVPGEEELAMGALASGGVRVLSPEMIEEFGLRPEDVERVVAREQAELNRRERVFRGNRPFPPLDGRLVIVADDGVATGATMRAAVRALRTQHPGRIVVAVPVAAPQALEALRPEVDELVYLLAPDPLLGIGAWYQDFAQLSDDQVVDYLHRARAPMGTHPPSQAAQSL